MQEKKKTGSVPTEKGFFPRVYHFMKHSRALYIHLLTPLGVSSCPLLSLPGTPSALRPSPACLLCPVAGSLGIFTADCCFCGVSFSSLPSRVLHPLLRFFFALLSPCSNDSLGSDEDRFRLSCDSVHPPVRRAYPLPSSLRVYSCRLMFSL